MPYTKEVRFTKTNQYGCGPEDTVDEFLERCETKAFVDYDGFGHPVKEGKCDPEIYIYPSLVQLIPPDATHIVWYNR